MLKVGKLQFPQSVTKLKTFGILKNLGIKIPVELETKIDESEKLKYIITLIETWNTIVILMNATDFG